MSILAKTVKQALRDEDLDFKIRNIQINGCAVGCSGLVEYHDKTVYINTDIMQDIGKSRILVRTAKSDKDYCGGTNTYCTLGGLREHIRVLMGRELEVMA